MRTTLSILPVILAAALLGGCGGDTTGLKSPGIVTHLDVVSGDGASAQVGTQLSSPLVVKALDASGRPVAGQIVNFVVVAGGGSIFAPAAQTNAQGIAQNLWTLGTSVTDSQVVEVRAVDPNTGAPIVFARFHATATAAPPVTLAKQAGDAQQAFVGAAEAESLAVVVLDKYGNPVAGSVVIWTAVSGNGTLSPTSSTSNALGRATTSWTLGGRMGAETVTASLGSVASVQFTATGTLSPSATLQKVSGDAQTATVATALPDAIVIAAKLPNGEPIIGAKVVFNASTAQPPLDQTTDSIGVARTAWVLGTKAGADSLVGTLGTSQVLFTATAVPDKPTAIDLVLPSAPACSAFPCNAGPYFLYEEGTELQVQVNSYDTFGNRSGGLTVDLADSFSGVTLGRITTDVNGSGSIVWTLPVIPGSEVAQNASLTARATLSPASISGTKTISVGHRPVVGIVIQPGDTTQAPTELRAYPQDSLGHLLSFRPKPCDPAQWSITAPGSIEAILGPTGTPGFARVTYNGPGTYTITAACVGLTANFVAVVH